MEMFQKWSIFQLTSIVYIWKVYIFRKNVINYIWQASRAKVAASEIQMEEVLKLSKRKQSWKRRSTVAR